MKKDMLHAEETILEYAAIIEEAACITNTSKETCVLIEQARKKWLYCLIVCTNLTTPEAISLCAISDTIQTIVIEAFEAIEKSDALQLSVKINNRLRGQRERLQKQREEDR